MKQAALKSKTDPRKLLVFAFISAFLLITSVTGYDKAVYTQVDFALSPFLIATRNAAFNTKLLFNEMTAKSAVLKENIQLRREIATYEQLRAENKDLKDQLARMQGQVDIAPAEGRPMKMVQVTGAQKLYTSSPELLLFLDATTQVKQWDPVFYDKQTLFGFVKEVDGRTAKVVPFYSPEISFNIPVQSLRDTTQKGFIQHIDNGIVQIRNVPKEVGVSEGDTWVTTNDVTEVPPSMSVGNVSLVEKDAQESFQRIVIHMPFSLGTTTYLMVYE